MANSLENLYRTIVVDSAAMNKSWSITDIISRFPVAPTAIYPQFDATKLAGVTATGTEIASFIRVLLSEFRVYYENGTVNDNIIDTIAPLAFIGLYQAKQELGGVFGLDSGSTLFASALRPITVTLSSQNWITNVATAGWNTAFFTFNTANSSATPDLNLYNNVTMLVFGFIDESPSAKLQELQFITPSSVKEGVKVFDLNGFPNTTGLMLLDQAYYIGKNLKYTVDMNFSSTGAAKIIPFGIQFMNAQYFNQE